jgi:hypothetical protein
VIRFSAALVAVAIGVLVGGIATSKLVLVYIAIVISAAALVTLAIGVMLKREELFGEGQGLAPAGAGASPALPAHPGAGSWNQTRPRPNAPVTPPAPQTGTAAAFESAAPADQTPSAGAVSSASTVSSASAVPSAGTVSPLADSEPTQWDAPSAGGWWSTPAPASLAPAGRDTPPSSTAPGPGPSDTAPSDTAPGTSDSVSGTPDTAPGQLATQADPVLPPPAPAAWGAPAATPAPPNWFGWPGEQDRADEAPATAPGRSIPDETVTLPATTPPGTSASGDTVTSAGAAVSGDEEDDDEDWPIHYSWLDDETDDAVAGADADEADEGGHEAEVADLASARESAVAEPEIAADLEPEPEIAELEPEPEIAELESEPEVIAEPEIAELGPEPEAGPALAAVPDHDADDSGSLADAGDAVSETGLVSVVRGVPRYHQPDCVLIRFMPEGDVQQLPVPEAKAAGCTPCTACQPQG